MIQADTKSSTLFVYSDRAFLSERALRRYEAVTAAEASTFEYGGEAPSTLWRVQGGPAAGAEGPLTDLITADFGEAAKAFRAGADCLFNVVVVRRMADNVSPSVIVVARGREHVPDYVRAWLNTPPSDLDNISDLE